MYSFVAGVLLCGIWVLGILVIGVLAGIACARRASAENSPGDAYGDDDTGRMMGNVFVTCFVGSALSCAWPVVVPVFMLLCVGAGVGYFGLRCFGAAKSRARAWLLDFLSDSQDDERNHA